jgi:hypothetical protein
MEEKKWIYKTEIVGGLSLRFEPSRADQIDELCNKMGSEGWELAGITYNPYNQRFFLVFKKPTN